MLLFICCWKLLLFSRPTPRVLIFLTIRLLVAGASTWTTELLRLASARVGNDQRSVVTNQGVSDLLLGGLIDELLVVGQQTLGDRLTDGVDLRCVTTTSDPDSHVNLGEVLLSQKEHGLESLDSQSWGIKEIQRDSIDSDHTSTGLDESDGNRVSLATEGLNVLTL